MPPAQGRRKLRHGLAELINLENQQLFFTLYIYFYFWEHANTSRSQTLKVGVLLIIVHHHLGLDCSLELLGLSEAEFRSRVSNSYDSAEVLEICVCDHPQVTWRDEDLLSWYLCVILFMDIHILVAGSNEPRSRTKRTKLCAGSRHNL